MSTMSPRLSLRGYPVCFLVLVVLLGGAGGPVQALRQSESATAEEPAQTVEPSQPSEHGEATAEEHGESEGQEPSPWMQAFQWLNFALVLAGIVYASKKIIAPFLEQRAQAIQEDMAQSSRVIADANRRLGEVEGKLRQLDDEIRALRQAAFQEAEAERARLEQQAQADAQKIVRAAEQEIATAAKAARQELKVYTAELAVSLAGKKIQASMSPQAGQSIFQSFVQELRHKGGEN